MGREIIIIDNKEIDITNMPFVIKESVRDIPFLIEYLETMVTRNGLNNTGD